MRLGKGSTIVSIRQESKWVQEAFIWQITVRRRGRSTSDTSEAGKLNGCFNEISCKRQDISRAPLPSKVFKENMPDFTGVC